LPESPSVELFRQRVGSVAPGIEVEYATAAALCDRLDRLPLAIELAAARCKALSPEQIVERLTESLDLLRGGRDADPRQQTLRATIEWSYRLLSDVEQQVFRALSIFRGGCTLEAAESVCDADLDTLQSLVEKSLLRFMRERYWMLETIREFARERLGKTTDADRIARRHARYYLTRLEEINPVLRGPRTGEFIAWYAAEEDNLRATLDRLAAISPGDAARVAYLLSSYWIARGTLDEGRERLHRLVATPSLDGLTRASLLGHRGAPWKPRCGRDSRRGCGNACDRRRRSIGAGRRTAESRVDRNPTRKVRRRRTPRLARSRGGRIARRNPTPQVSERPGNLSPLRGSRR
jgi:predicted ATPase